jgi:site-specific DNA-methyltransferase (adenine-specific)
MITSGLMSSNSPEWATPQSFFDMLNREFNFTLDPCCTHENAKCKKHYTKEDDGLSKSWGGKEYSVILHMAESYLNGLKNAMRNLVRVLWLLCLFLLGLIHDGFTTISITSRR